MVWDAYRTIRINSPPKTLWRILMDVPNWPTWDIDLATATLDKPLPPPPVPVESVENATGTLNMKFNQTFRFTLHSVKEDRYVAYRTQLPGAVADWYWEVTPVESTPDAPAATATAGATNSDAQALDLRMGVKFTGWATFAYRALIGSRTLQAFDICTKNLKELCETGKITPQP